MQHISSVHTFTRVGILSLLLLSIPRPLINSSHLELRQQAAGGEYFSTLPVGAALPSDEECAARVRRHPWEPRPENRTANNYVPVNGRDYNIPKWDWSIGMDPRADAFRQRITGNFQGTTDEIIQWASCKWGFDEDINRAVARKETNWYQNDLGDWTDDTRLDCVPRHPRGSDPSRPTECPQSFGLPQVRKGAVILDTWPASEDSTAFAMDYVLATRRACFEGYQNWLNDVERGRQYAAGDEWGCVGAWYAGRWYTYAAEQYMYNDWQNGNIKMHYDQKPWVSWGYPGVNGGTPQGTTATPPSAPATTSALVIRIAILGGMWDAVLGGMRDAVARRCGVRDPGGSRCSTFR